MDATVLRWYAAKDGTEVIAQQVHRSVPGILFNANGLSLAACRDENARVNMAIGKQYSEGDYLVKVGEDEFLVLSEDEFLAEYIPVVPSFLVGKKRYIVQKDSTVNWPSPNSYGYWPWRVIDSETGKILLCTGSKKDAQQTAKSWNSGVVPPES